MFSRLEVKDPRERTQRSQRFPGDTKMAIAVKTSLFIYFFKRRTAWDGKPHFVNTHVKLSSCRVFKASELRTLFRFSIRYKVSVELDSFFQTFYIEYSVSYSYIFFYYYVLLKPVRLMMMSQHQSHISWTIHYEVFTGKEQRLFPVHE